MSKDRARPFSRKHRRYWIPVTGGMIAIGILNVAIGYCSYRPPSDVHERIIPDVPDARRGAPAPPPRAATGCAPALVARVGGELPGATLVACAADHATVVRGDKTLELALAGDEIRGVDETLTLPEIPAAVMRAFAVAYPRILPARAIKRAVRGAPATYELTFPPGAAHAAATLAADGQILGVR